MATVNLGAIKFNWKGAYNNSTQYQVDDVVSSGGSSYVCILASQGNAVSNGTYWNVMSQAGTNGTDIGTTLTTQGDILYRDGSGLQRLAAGTSGQALLTGGAGANPSWGTLSSDFVKLASTTVSSGVSSVELDGVFDDTTYASYYARISGGVVDTSGTQRKQIAMRVKTAAGVQTATGYVFNMNYQYRRWDNDSQNFSYSNTESATHINLHDWQLSQYGTQDVNIWFSGPQSTSFYKGFSIDTIGWQHTSTGSDGPYTFSPINISAYYPYTTAITGLHFFNSSNANINGGTFTLYGIKK